MRVFAPISRIALLLAGPLLAGSLLVGPYGCVVPDDEILVKRRLKDIVQAAQEQDVSRMLERVADDFVGPNGASKQQVKQMLTGRLLADRWLRVFERELEVDVKADKATAMLRLVLAQGNKVQRLEDLVPTDAMATKFQIKLEKRDGQWWIVGATYEEEPLTVDGLTI